MGRPNLELKVSTHGFPVHACTGGQDSKAISIPEIPIDMDAGRVREVHSVLHLIFHRNKNQHRRSRWWKWLAILKRATSDLATALEASPPTQHCLKPSLCAYGEYLAKEVIPRCYLSFSTVVADGQFSSLGIVLLALLARIAKETRFDRRIKTVVQQDGSRHIKDVPKTAPTGREDIGEVVHRNKEETFQSTVSSSNSKEQVVASTVVHLAQAQGSKRNLEADEKKPKKKKKRKDNAIDDLFDGLV